MRTDQEIRETFGMERDYFTVVETKFLVKPPGGKSIKRTLVSGENLFLYPDGTPVVRLPTECVSVIEYDGTTFVREYHGMPLPVGTRLEFPPTERDPEESTLPKDLSLSTEVEFFNYLRNHLRHRGDTPKED